FAFSAARDVHITLSRFRVKRLISLFSAEVLLRTSLTRRLLFRCSVSVVAHYREKLRSRKHKSKKTIRSLTFHP
ncbi:hypothetical protein, partial [Kluyvera intermedia]|uniref:hypothetical protein n=1 Tax=Kluyvera intermedia TaxID=61648 RepID=UPI00372CFC88